MKKLFTLAAWLCAAGLYAQAQEYVTPLNEVAVEKNQAAVAIGGSGGLDDGTYGDITVSGTGTILSLTGASNPTFTLFKVGNGATGPGSFDVLEDSDNGSNYIRTIGQSALSANRTYTLPDVGSDGTYAVSPTLYPGLPFNPTTTTVLFDDFYIKPALASVSTIAPAGLLSGVGSGTASGFISPSVNADGAHPGIVQLTTGTTTTGTFSINGGPQVNSSVDPIVIAGGEIVEWLVNIPTLADGTNTFKVWAGLCDIQSSAGDCADGLNVYSAWDAGATNNKWGCGAAGGSTRTTTNSTTVVTTGWHKLRVEVNSGATSVAYKVDGVELDCSPYSGGNIPSGITEGTGLQLRIGASAGCANNTLCNVAADYVYFYKPGISR